MTQIFSESTWHLRQRVDSSEQIFLARHSRDLIAQLPVFEKEQRRNSANVVLKGKTLVLVHVHFRDLDHARFFFGDLVQQDRPDMVLVAGDVNSTIACALVAAKERIPIAHVEAGLRSFDRSMPEEINRILTDVLSDLLFTTEESANQNLANEGVAPDKVFFVGNLMIDSLRGNVENARKSDVLARLDATAKSYGLVTLHRPSNVDNPNHLFEVTGALSAIASELRLYWAVHPRTRVQLQAQKVALHANIRLTEPLSYLDFLWLMSNSSVVLTDSGGIQEETTALGIPCLTLRENTERPVTIEEGTNILAGTRKASILQAWEKTKSNPKAGRTPQYWDGSAASRSVDVLCKYFAQVRRG